MEDTKEAAPSPFAGIRVVTFDLDDTLWRTWPVLDRASSSFHAFIQEEFPELHARFPPEQWNATVNDVVRAHPSAAHCMTATRKLTLQHCATVCGLPAEEVTARAYEAFITHRNRVEDHLVPGAMGVLQALHGRLEIGALSNGNADVYAIESLAPFFSFAVNPENAGAKKPNQAPFERALRLSSARAPHEVLHVGDSIKSDIAPAILFGCRTVWVKTGSKRSGTHPESVSAEQASMADAVLPSIASLPGLLAEWGVLGIPGNRHHGMVACKV